MKRRDLIKASAAAGAAELLRPSLSLAVTPCPPSQISVLGGTSSATTCTISSHSYSTNFLGVENPLSEGGVWSNVGQNWTRVLKSNGIAHGTQTGTSSYDDSYARLSHFPPNISASARIYKASGIPSGESHEVELLLRWADSSTSARGYECNLHHAGGYLQIVRWNGPRGNFTYLADQRGNVPVPKDGDIFKATITGNVIKAYLNDVLIVQATDSTFTDGNPGIGFYVSGAVSNSVFGYRSFSASAI